MVTSKCTAHWIISDLQKTEEVPNCLLPQPGYGPVLSVMLDNVDI